jgi:phosphoribosylformimino-5-aminoimidazole carboxamide ribotide isomerase
MNVVPVLDLLGGQVVRGIAGQRNNYRPIVSQLTKRTEPLAVARAIRSTFDLNRLYVADLDAILERRPNVAVYQKLTGDGFELLIDAGIRDAADAEQISKLGEQIEIVVGLETCVSPSDLAAIAAQSPGVTFSIDLKNGQPCRSPDCQGWSDLPNEILRQVIQTGVNSVLLLDLADVGTGTGGSTDSMCRFLREHFPAVRLITGGGVRNRNDLERLSALGVDDVLVASALHDAGLDRIDIQSVCSQRNGF